MMPVIVRYFIPTIGVRNKLLEFSTEKGETSEIISSLIIKTAQKNKIFDKIVGFCGDNCPTNFGSRDRRGNKNVFYRLKQLIPELFGIGCCAHITHNTLKHACDCLPIDIECIVVKIYSHFYIHTVRVEALKEICDQSEVEYSQLLGYAKTRFLALGPAIGSILQLYEPLKQYFLELRRCPSIIKAFFESPFSKLWLLFVKDQTEYFQQTVLNVEGDKVTTTQCSNELENLKGNLMLRITEKYIDPATEKEMKMVVDSGNSTLEYIESVFHTFYDDALEYLSAWTESMCIFRRFAWIELNKFPDWTTIKNSFEFMSTKTKFDWETNSSKFFQQFGLIKTFCTDEKISEWNTMKASAEDRWVEIFKHMDQRQLPYEEFAHVIEFISCFPGTSASVERLFAKAKKIWTPEKSALEPSTLKSILIVKNNMEYGCDEFHTFLKGQPALLQKISPQEKYNFKKPQQISGYSPGAMSIDTIPE